MHWLTHVVLSLGIACSTTETTTSTTSTAPAPTAAAATDSTSLGAYLNAAASAKLFEIKMDASGPVKRTELKQLDEKATRDYLARLDLAQHADGPVVRCPDDTELELLDAGGKLLGTIGFCQDHARLRVPGGKSGGIKATRP